MKTVFPRDFRRGSVAGTLMIVLAVLSVLALSMMFTTARRSDAASLAAYGARAKGAAEAAANMAMKELIGGVDDDGDGGIGTISNDSNTATDPTINNSTRLWATRSDSGGVTTITARAQNTYASRAIQISATAGSSSATVLAAYSRSWTTNHYTSTWSGSAWGASALYATEADEGIWVKAASCPTRDEIVVATQDYQLDVRLRFRIGGTFGTSIRATADSGSLYTHRRMDVAYEQSSGDLLVAYYNKESTNIGYRTASNGTVSSQSTLTLPATDHLRFLALVPKPGSDEIAMLCVNATSKLYACIWNGSSWGSVQTLNTSVSAVEKECFAATYERTSGKLLVVYGTGTSNQGRYRTYSGGTWSAESTMPATVNAPQWMRLASKPGSNEIACGILDLSDAVFGVIWNGSSWGTVQTFGSTGAVCEHRRIDVAYEPSGTRALVAYSTGASTLKYRTWNGSSWSAQQTGPNFGGVVSIVQLLPGSSGSDIYGLCSDEDWQLNAFTWNGSTISGTLINDPLGGETNCEAFSLVSAGAGTTRITGWKQVNP